MMIRREQQKSLAKDAKKSPVIAVLGPRQSGKTTLVRATFTKHAYVSLEDEDIRDEAFNDPRAFLDHYGTKYGVIIDEVQHVPSLLSYIQTRVDERKVPKQRAHKTRIIKIKFRRFNNLFIKIAIIMRQKEYDITCFQYRKPLSYCCLTNA